MTLRPFLTALAVSLAVAGANGMAPSAVADPPGPYQTDREDLEWIVLRDAQVNRVRLHMECDGEPLAKAWPKAIRGQFDLAALKQGDQAELDAAGAERLPSAWALLQKTSGIFAHGPGSNPLWQELDRSGTKKIRAKQLIEYYRAAGLSEALIGAGKASVEKLLGPALIVALDADGDGKISEKELATAESLLGKLDANGDELITAAELVPRAAYPGAGGTHWLRAPGLDAMEPAWNREFPLLVLPHRRADVAWCQALIARLDRNGDEQLDRKEILFLGDGFARLDQDQNGKLSAGELAPWRNLPPDASWIITIGKTTAVRARPAIDPTLISPNAPSLAWPTDRLEASLAGVQIVLRADAGTLGPKWQEFRERIEAKFREVDSRGTGQVPALGEKVAMSEWECVLYCADTNCDGKVSQIELTNWLKANEAYSRSVAMITLLDHGNGLFALLDADCDGGLSLRELRLAKRRLEQSGAMEKGLFLPERIPGQLRITVGFGPPKRLLFPKSQRGPAWFQAMDRNGDGDLSRKECPFPGDWFERWDKDRDGLIDFQEAAAIPMAEKAVSAVP